MIRYLYSIRDVKSGCDLVFTEVNDAVAVRNFQASVMNTDSLLNKFPEDYQLVRIGVLDTDSGSIEPEPLRAVSNASDFI